MNQIDRLLTIMQRLRDPENGCPWDKEQTFATIAPYTLWICPYISRHLLSLNPLLACCRRYSRGER